MYNGPTHESGVEGGPQWSPLVPLTLVTFTGVAVNPLALLGGGRVPMGAKIKVFVAETLPTPALPTDIKYLDFQLAYSIRDERFPGATPFVHRFVSCDKVIERDQRFFGEQVALLRQRATRVPLIADTEVNCGFDVPAQHYCFSEDIEGDTVFITVRYIPLDRDANPTPSVGSTLQVYYAYGYDSR